MFNIINSTFTKILYNRLSFYSKKNYFLNLISKSWKNLKKRKINPNILYFLIISKLKIIFDIKKKKFKRRKSVFLKQMPFILNTKKRYKKSVKLFLIPFFLNKKKNFRFNFLLENCFLIFLNKNKKNVAIWYKKYIYLKVIENKRYFRY